MQKIQRAAIKAKELGYKHIYSIVKSHFNTTYVHVNDIDDVIANGWTPASRHGIGNWHGRVGISSRRLPEGSICRTDAFRLVD